MHSYNNIITFDTRNDTIWCYITLFSNLLLAYYNVITVIIINNIIQSRPMSMIHWMIEITFNYRIGRTTKTGNPMRDLQCNFYYFKKSLQHVE